MIQEGTEDQGNPVQEIGRSDEVQEIQGGLEGPGRVVKSKEIKKVFGGQVQFEMELEYLVGSRGIWWCPGGIWMKLTQMSFVHFQYQVHRVYPHFSDLYLKFFPPRL